MSQTNSIRRTEFRSRFLFLTVSAIALWLVLPIAMQISSSMSQAQTTPAIGPALVANLTAPAPAAVAPPTGVAYYATNTIGTTTTNVFHVDVANVILPAPSPSTTPAPLSVFLNNTNIGSITLDMMHHGVLHLTTANGGTVPTPVAGDTVSVKNGPTVVLRGVFAAPPPPPSPTVTPTRTPTPPPPTPMPTPIAKLFAPLSVPVPAASTIVARGLGEYTAFTATDRILEVYASNINLPNGTVINVWVAGNVIGQFPLMNHNGFLRLATMRGDAVPVITPGTTMSLKNSGVVLLAGTFATAPPPPTPTPTPSGSPSPTPTPNGTPVPARAFVSRLGGRAEVPPVTTAGRGFGVVMLNPAGDQIAVRLGFLRLSSAVTSITINGPAAPDANGPVVFTLAVPATALPAPPPPQTFTVNAQQVAQLRNGLLYFQVSTVNNPTGEIRGQIRPLNRRDDFDGDGLSDIGVIRANAGFAANAANDWYTLNSSDNTFSARSIGNPGDLNVQGDYDGDGIADVAMYTPATGTWQIRRSGTGETTFTQFGMSGDIPVVGDYDGDGINDLAVYRPSQGNWYVLRSSDGEFSATHWGAPNDRPVTGDFDGDGVNDLAVFRPSEGNWYIYRSSDNGLTALHWGTSGDQPVAGDFDGDGTNDVAVFRPSEGNWYIYRSSDNQMSAFHFGTPGDIPVACEFDGDGLTDVAVFRPSDGNWYILNSADNSLGMYHFGIATDRPIQTAYSPQ